MGVSNFINNQMEFVENMYRLLAIVLLLFFSLWHVREAVSRRLWMLPFRPSKFLALNAGTLALLSIVAKPSIEMPTNYSIEMPPSNDKMPSINLVSGFLLQQSMTVCAVIGAFMPSIASSFDGITLWSNVAGIALLIITTIVSIFLELILNQSYLTNYFAYQNDIQNLVVEHILAMAILFLLLLVILTQAMALQAIILDVKAIVSEQLDQLLVDRVKPGGYKRDIVMAATPIWSWEVVENNTCIKLLMVLSSNPLNVAARSPFTAIVGALVLLSFLLLITVTQVTPFIFSMLPVYLPVYCVCMLISVWRWMWVALQEDRSCLSLLFDAEPSYWRQKVMEFQCKLKSGPHRSRPNYVLEQGQYSFKEVLHYIAASFILYLVVPMNWVMVAITRFTHIVSALLLRKLIWVPIQALIMVVIKGLQRRRVAPEHGATNISSKYFALPLGVVCLAGEDARIVKQEFVGAATFIIQRQMKRAQKQQSNLKALVTLLQHTPKNSCVQGNGPARVLDQNGAPSVENLHVEHGYQYGWHLTCICLLSLMNKIEVEALGISEMYEAAVEAYWQALDMVEVVDEQYAPCIVCSKDTYASACTSEWLKLPKKKYRWLQKRRQLDLGLVDEIFKALLELTGRHIAEFNKTKSTHSYAGVQWPQQIVVSYTMHTVCGNLFRLWRDTEIVGVTNMGGGGGASVRIRYVVEYMKQLLAEVLSCCLSNLPLALDMSTTEAVRNFNTTKIEKGLFLVGQGKHLWAELQWPPRLVSSPMDIPGHLRHWIVHPNLSVNDP